MADFGDADLDGDLSLGFSSRRHEPRIEKKKLDEEPDGDLASMRFDMDDEEMDITQLEEEEEEEESHDIYSQVNASTATSQDHPPQLIHLLWLHQQPPKQHPLHHQVTPRGTSFLRW